MKKYIQKILAGIIALAMIVGNFAGTGISEVKAAQSFQELEVWVVEDDEDGEFVGGFDLVLKNTSGGEDIVIGPVDEFDGVTYTPKSDKSDIGKYVIEPAEDSGYAALNQVEFEITQAGVVADTTYMPLMLIVEAKEVVLTPEIDEVTSSISETEREGETATITVKGTNLDLLETVCCRLWYETKEGREVFADVAETIAVSGDADTEKTFDLELPSASDYPDAVKWLVRVYSTDTDMYFHSAVIRIISEVKANLKAAIEETMTLEEADYTKESWAVLNAAIEDARIVATNINATDEECEAAITAIKTAIKGLAPLATEDSKESLNEAIAAAEKLNKADYTAESWKTYNDAVEAAKLLAEDENATDAQYQEALKAINDAKEALVAVTTSDKTPVYKVAKISVTGISKKVAAGKKIQLTAAVSPSNASNKAVTWSTSNKKYATVNANGKVTVKKAGAGKTVTITATAADGSNVKATYKIQIKKHAVKSIKLKAKKTVKAGKSLKVKAAVKTTGKKANKTLKWISSNTKYATVNSKGKVSFKKAGKGKTVKITAKATDGSNKKATIKIKIK